MASLLFVFAIRVGKFQFIGLFVYTVIASPEGAWQSPSPKEKTAENSSFFALKMEIATTSVRTGLAMT